jgi:hypothetical protein
VSQNDKLTHADIEFAANYDWKPLTEEAAWRNAGMGDVWDKAESGDKLAQLLRERVRAAEKAMEPAIAAAKAEMERAWFENPSHPSGLSLLTGDEP